MKEQEKKKEEPAFEKIRNGAAVKNHQTTKISIYDLDLGEYFLHVYILETANLNVDGDLNAIINVTGLDTQKYTKVMKGLGPTSKTFWGEHVFLQKKFDKREELENARFTISVFNHSTVLKNDKIGFTSIDLLNVYGQNNHCMLEKWAVLTNPGKNVRAAMGFVKFSVCFDRINRIHPNLEALSMANSQASFELVAIPPEINLQSKQLRIKVFRGKNVVPMDIDGTADPFVKFNVSGTKIQTCHKPSTLNPIFYQVLYIPLLYPAITDKMKVTFKDNDLLGNNETIGSTFYLLEEIFNGKYSKPHWTYFYGGHDKVNDKEFLRLMNKNSELGSKTKGALLLSMDIFDAEDTKFAVEDMSKEEVLEENDVTKLEFTAKIDIEYIENLKSDASELKLCTKWGSDRGIFSQPVTYKRGVLIYFKSFTIKETFEVSKKMDIYLQIPDLIVSVVNGNDHISYLRLKPKNFLINQAQPFYESTTRMQADLAVADTPEDKAGIIKMRIGFGTSETVNQLTLSWPALPQKPLFEKIYLLIHLIRAKDLMPADASGTSDPIVQFYHLGSTTKSSLFPETLNPSWNERISMQSFLVNGDIAPLIVNVSDRDENFVGSISYEFLGSTYVPLSKSDFARTKNQVIDVKPRWYDISIGKNLNMGKILLGVKVVREEFFPVLQKEKLIDETAEVTFTRTLPFNRTKHFIKINILGLRNLQSSGILPVKSVSVKINTSSLRPVDQIQKGSAFSNLTAISKNGGSNPSIGTVLSLTVELPDELILIPTLSCQVLENSLSFLKGESLIGTFQIELAIFAYISKITMIEKLKVIQQYREKLKEVDSANFNAHDAILNKVNGIIKHLEAGVLLNQSFIQEEEQEIYKKGQDIKENIGMMTASNLLTNFDKSPVKSLTSGPEGEFIDAKIKVSGERVTNTLAPEDKSKAESNGQKGIVLKDEGFFSVFIPDTNQIAADGEQLRLLSSTKLNIDNDSRRLLATKFSEIIPQDKVVILPNTMDPFKAPPNPQFYALLGYKSKKVDNRHYRVMFKDELENSFYMGEDLYAAIDIFRGKKHSFEKKNILTRLFSRLEENYRMTGTFKGNVEIIQEEVLMQIIDLKLSEKELNSLEIPRSISEWKFSKLDADMLKGTNMTITVYIISATFYTSEDLNSENDSYLQVTFANNSITDNKVVSNSNNPKFFKKFSFEGSFPGPSDIVINFMDQDDLNPDDLIGRTIIDAERRFFDRRWRSFPEKPIETRKIYHPNSEAPVGETLLWLDIEPLSKSKKRTWNIDPRPVTTLELRIVIWEIQNMPLLDFEGVSDLYVSVSLPNFDLMQKTDTHLRAQNGFGSFNWRTVFKLKIDENSRPEHYRANIRVFDKDLVSSDDYAADTTIDFYGLVDAVLENEAQMNLLGPSQKGEQGSKEYVIYLQTKTPVSDRNKRPYVLVSVDLLPEDVARNSPVGIGRSAPNQDPYLPPPKGRFTFSLNPFSLLEQMMGPVFKAKLCGICVIIFVLLFILILLPIFISTLVSMIIVNKINP